MSRQLETQPARPRTQVTDLSFNNRAFQRNGENYFILSGEMHYFRIAANRWQTHLKRMKEAGLNTISTYIPWSLHEQIEGRPDFSGRDCANLDLERFIGLCQDLQLNLTVKPGPYILAELALHGIPRWFFETYPDAIARDANGHPYPAKYTCLAHPDYRCKAMQWYDAVMPLLASHQIARGGPIILMQVCNEVGLFQWLGGAGDYSTASLQDYRIYLASVYGTIGALNAQYGTTYEEWDDVRPPAGPVTCKADRFAYQDWHRYHRRFYAGYIKWLIDEIRRRGVEVPLFHNVPGWVFGRAKQMPVCLSMYDELSRLYPDIILGVDHIPENPSYRNFHDDRVIDEFTKAIQGGNGPLYVAELQAGTREANVNIYPVEMELFYKASLANGIVSMNYYMFSQGKNPSGWGVYDSSFYLQTPLDSDGIPGDCYPVIRRINQLIQTHGTRLCDATTSPSQALAFYSPYYHRELTRPLFTGENFDPGEGMNSRLDPKTITEELLFDSVGKLLAADNEEYDAVDITQANTDHWSRYKQIWLAATDQMDADTQRKLLRYVHNGGHLICFPTVPESDLRANPCTILRDGLGVQTDEVLDDFDGMIVWADTGDPIHATRYIETFKPPALNARVIAVTQDGKPCGLKLPCGSGSTTILGTGFVYQAVAHRTAWQKLGLNEHFRGPILCDNPLLITRTRMVDQNSGYFFMLNYHNQPQQTKVSFDNALCAEARVYVPPFNGLMLPLHLPLGDIGTLLFTTSEVLRMELSPSRVVLDLSGHPKTEGHIILALNDAVRCVSLNDRTVPFKQQKQQLALTYEHALKPQVLTIAVNQNDNPRVSK